MADVNEELFDALVRHQIYLMRLSGGIRRRIEDILNATEEDLAEKIRDRLRNATGGLTPTNLRRMQVLRRIIANIRTRAWDQIDELWLSEMIDIAKAEPEFMAGAMRTVAPVTLDLVIPPVATLRALVTSRPFEGRTLREWAQSIRRDDLRRIESAVQVGIASGESSAQIARRVVGTARLRGVDGMTEITRRAAAAITRTAVSHVSNAAKQEFYRENSDVIQEELYVATLDARTTPVCRANDGKRFALGKGPMPPLHFNCRSLRVALFDGRALGTRPAKPVTERQLVREFAQRRGLSGVTTRDSLPRGTKGAYDKFAQARIRELTGQVRADVSYQQWLKRQSAAFQDDILGKTKGALFRRGGLQLDKFVNRAGDELSLSDLARRHRDAFVAAGLDPEDFI
ncbi:MAG TPA: minor capsid protein [Trueperaceae bacterium]|nr:minor capsid protein [Trueperaceae bacterium]